MARGRGQPGLIEATGMRFYVGRVALGLAILLTGVGWAWAQNDAATHIAPKGELRVAVLAWNPVLASRSVNGQLSGVSVELANALAAKLGVPVHLVPYQNLVRYNQSFAKDEWDISLGPRELFRSDTLAFSDVFMAVDNGYVARAGISLRAASEVDRSGIRVAVEQGSPLAGYLSRTLIKAKIVNLPVGANFARDALSLGRADVYADTTAEASHIAAGLPGATILIGSISTVQMSIAVPKKNAAVLPLVNEFVAEAKHDGLIADAIKHANLRGVRPAR